MNVNELRIAGHFEIPDAQVDDVVEVALRVRIVGLRRDQIDVSGHGNEETIPGALLVEAVAADWPEPAPLPADYWETAE